MPSATELFRGEIAWKIAFAKRMSRQSPHRSTISDDRGSSTG